MMQILQTLVLSSQFPQIQILSATGSVLWASTYQYSAGNFSLAQGVALSLGAFTLVMQTDSNLVLYQGGTPLWSTWTSSPTCNNCYAVFQPDGNFVVYNGATPVWASNTDGHVGATLVLSSQSPYLEILGAPGQVLWLAFYTISGQVTASGSGLSGVTVGLSGSNAAGRVFRFRPPRTPMEAIRCPCPRVVRTRLHLRWRGIRSAQHQTN